MHDRILQLERFIGSVSPNWDQVAREIDSHIDGLIMSLIAQNNEETRGKIKALRDLRDLPTVLKQELDAIKAELPD